MQHEIFQPEPESESPVLHANNAHPAQPKRALGRALRSAKRIRSKLILLHTLFSLVLAVILLLVIRWPINSLVMFEEQRECVIALELWDASPQAAENLSLEGVEVYSGQIAGLMIPSVLAEAARANSGDIVTGRMSDGAAAAARWLERTESFVVARAYSNAARAAQNRLYLVLTIALLAVYGLIALTLEVFVLPRQVYQPIERLRRADEAVQSGQRERELIPEDRIPSDELGDIMRSRNRSILKLRAKESELEGALAKIEDIALELRRKNHLLETARRNLADQDRLVSIGMMAAGIAHELNTPLAVLKGSVERLAENPTAAPDRERVQLMLRVVKRLERLSEGLLDFARARPATNETVRVKAVIEEAWTLVTLDREARQVRFANKVSDSIAILGNADRLTQVFVNLLRNAVDAMNGAGEIELVSEELERDDRRWLSISVIDTGPGIEPGVLAHLFEPFTTTRLDSRGTGLGLAVAEGIVQEHGGLLLARNVSDGIHGALFEVVLPIGGEHANPIPDEIGRNAAESSVN